MNGNEWKNIIEMK